MLWFITASLVSAYVRFGFVNWLEPGHVTKLPIQDANSVKEILDNSKGFSFGRFCETRIVPKVFLKLLLTMKFCK